MYKNIVITLDLSEKSSIQTTLAPALNFANAFNSKLYLVHIIPDFGTKMLEGYLPKNWVEHQKQKCHEQIQSIIQKYVPQEIKIECHIDRGAIYDKVIDYANQVEADLIIISAVRPKFKDYMLGPNASKIVRHSSVSVMVVRE